MLPAALHGGSGYLLDNIIYNYRIIHKITEQGLVRSPATLPILTSNPAMLTSNPAILTSNPAMLTSQP